MANITLNEVAYDILEIYRANVRNTDEIDIRQIKYWVQTTRARLLKQKYDKPFHTIDNNYIQKVRPNGQAVSTELTDSSAYTSIPTGTYMVRTAITIPPTIERDGIGHTFTRIGPADQLGIEFNIIPYDAINYYGNGKFNHDSVAAYLLDDRIYFMSKNPQSVLGLKYVDIRGVFQNPLEVELINNSLYTDDDAYPINLNMIEDMKSIILGKEFKLSFKPPVDTEIVDPNVVNKNI